MKKLDAIYNYFGEPFVKEPMKKLSFDFGEQYARDRIRESPLGSLKIKSPPPALKLTDSSKLIEAEKNVPNPV